jgi:tetratricopeptide (TPR) repeat protein
MHLMIKRSVLTIAVAALALSFAPQTFAQEKIDTTKILPGRPVGAPAQADAKGKPAATKGQPAITQPKGFQPKVIGKPTMKLHTLPEIVEIIKASNLNYSVDTVKSAPQAIFPIDSIRPVLAGGQYIKYVDSVPQFAYYKQPQMAEAMMGFAGQAFDDKSYAEAIGWYRKVQMVDPKYQPIYSYLGEAYLVLDSLDSAKVNLGKSVMLNFADFMAHRLLAKTLWKQGNKEEAVKEMTTAHVLNINNQLIVSELMDMRLNSGRMWFGQRFEPQYRLVKGHDTVYVTADVDWIGYAMVKAVWKYEPKYAIKMLGFDPTGSTYVMQEEREGVIAALTTNKKLGFLSPVIDQGYLDDFIMYDIVAPRYPQEIAILSKEQILRLVGYVDKFH